MVAGMTNNSWLSSSRKRESSSNLMATASNVWGAAASARGHGAGLVRDNRFAYNQHKQASNAAMFDADYSYSFADIGKQ